MTLVDEVEGPKAASPPAALDASAARFLVVREDADRILKAWRGRASVSRDCLTQAASWAASALGALREHGLESAEHDLSVAAALLETAAAARRWPR